jgi:N-acetylglucosaminyl-diphospho-decaprenol L-rhamnosyltransferase
MRGIHNVLVNIVVVNFRTPDLTIDCIRSVEDACNLSGLIRVELVDNASPDQSAQSLSDAISGYRWERWVQLTIADRNGGFAYGNNVGIGLAFSRDARFDYILLLNPDTVVQPDAIAQLVDFLDTNPKVGISGSRLEDSNGNAQESAFRFPTMASELLNGIRLRFLSRLLNGYVVAPPVRKDSHRTDWVAGASMLIRREVIEQIGLLDEEYFMYYEEVDFCKRAQQAGWECWYVPSSRVVHLVGQSSGINSADKKPKRRPAYVFESRRRYFQKHHGRLYAILADVAWLTTFPLWRLRRWIQCKPDTDPPYLWWDMLRHSSLWCRIKL